MRTEAVLDRIDAGEFQGKGNVIRVPLPGLSTTDIATLRLSGNPVAALATETTDKEYIALHRNSNVLSHSIRSSLHSCARRFIQEKIAANSSALADVATNPNLDFVFGHAVGAGAQALLAFERLDYALYATFLSWHATWEFGHEDWARRKNKTIEQAVLAVESFSYFRSSVLEEWELFVLPDGRPAIELSFCINFGKTKYFGHIDCILKNRRTGRIAVGEIKTSGYSSIDEASYRNSGQALGYAIVLDSIVGDLADYDVHYLVYSAPSIEWTWYPFAKSVAHKMEFVQDILIDSSHVQQYFKIEHFPKNGANCMQFNRRCQFFGECDLVNKEAMRTLPVLGDREYPVDFYFDVKDLVKQQVENVT